MRAAILLPLALAACGPHIVAPPPLPSDPPADTERACLLPAVAPDAVQALVDHRLALVECGSAGRINAAAWRMHARGPE